MIHSESPLYQKRNKLFEQLKSQDKESLDYRETLKKIAKISKQIHKLESK